MSGVQTITITDEDFGDAIGQRLDRWFKRRFPHIGHGRVEKLLRTGQLRINGKRSKGAQRLASGDIIRIPPLPDPSQVKEAHAPNPADVQFMRSLILYEDEDLIALNKPLGLAVQGGTKTTRHIDGLLPTLGENCRLVHRLDRDTTGVLLIARSANAAKWIGKAFQHRRAEKTYWGITNGVPRPQSGEIKGYMVKERVSEKVHGRLHDREIMQAVRHGTAGAKHARTLYYTAATAGTRAAWVIMQPLTGRTHQLRLHMQLLGAPIAGDPKYLTDRDFLGGLTPKLHLHAKSLVLPRPERSDLLIEAPLPPHMKKSFSALGFETKNPPSIDWQTLS